MILAEYVQHALKTWYEKVWMRVGQFVRVDDADREIVEQVLINIALCTDQASATETTARQMITLSGINACRVQLRDQSDTLHICARAGSFTGEYAQIAIEVAGQDLGVLEIWSEPENDVHLLTVEQLSLSVARQLGWALLGMRQVDSGRCMPVLLEDLTPKPPSRHK